MACRLHARARAARDSCRRAARGRGTRSGGGHFPAASITARASPSRPRSRSASSVVRTSARRVLRPDLSAPRRLARALNGAIVPLLPHAPTGTRKGRFERMYAGCSSWHDGRRLMMSPRPELATDDRAKLDLKRWLSLYISFAVLITIGVSLLILSSSTLQASLSPIACNEGEVLGWHASGTGTNVDYAYCCTEPRLRLGSRCAARRPGRAPVLPPAAEPRGRHHRGLEPTRPPPTALRARAEVIAPTHARPADAVVAAADWAAQGSFDFACARPVGRINMQKCM